MFVALNRNIEFAGFIYFFCPPSEGIVGCKVNYLALPTFWQLFPFNAVQDLVTRFKK